MPHALKRFLLSTAWLACLGWALSSAPTRAEFTVLVDTSFLVGNPAGPFSLNFQLNDGSGSGDGNNTATLSNFLFGGGGPVGVPITFGGASGNLATQVNLDDSSAFFNSFTQGFTPGATLQSDVMLTGNVDVGPTPDQFSFAILDGMGFELPTLGPGDAFVIVNITSATPPIQTFPSSAFNIPAPTIIQGTIPEPSSFVLGGLGLLGLLGYCWQRSRRAA